MDIREFLILATIARIARTAAHSRKQGRVLSRLARPYSCSCPSSAVLSGSPHCKTMSRFRRDLCMVSKTIIQLVIGYFALSDNFRHLPESRIFVDLLA